MLVLKKIQEIQSCFKDSTHPGLSLITNIYKTHRNRVLSLPVAYESGYGYGCGKNGTFLEKTERFIRFMSSCRDTLKALYAVNPDDISTYLFLYDIGKVALDENLTRESERDSNSMAVCGQTVSLLFEASIELQLADRANAFISNMPILFSSLSSGESTGYTSLDIAVNIIRLDKTAIESLTHNRVVINIA